MDAWPPPSFLDFLLLLGFLDSHRPSFPSQLALALLVRIILQLPSSLSSVYDETTVTVLLLTPKAHLFNPKFP